MTTSNISAIVTSSSGINCCWACRRRKARRGPGAGGDCPSLRLNGDENADCGDLLAYPELLLSITRSALLSSPVSNVSCVSSAPAHPCRQHYLPHSAEHLLIIPTTDDTTRRPAAVCFVLSFYNDSDSAKAPHMRRS